ncbi:MAG: TonB-dependent receptor plug domain-containing protein [Bacteroidota bacterium]
MRILRTLLVVVALTVPEAADAQRRSIQSVPIAVTAISESEVRMPVLDLDVFVAGLPGIQVSSGQTDAQGQIRLRGIAGSPDLSGLRGGRFAAAYVPAGTGSDAALVLGVPEQLEAIEVLRGPQGTLFGADAVAGAIRLEAIPRAECPGIEFEVDLAENTLTASPASCDEPVLVEVVCPPFATLGEAVQFDAVVSEAVEARIDFRLASGLSLDLGSTGYEPRLDWEAAYGSSHTFTQPGLTDVEVTATNDNGTDSVTCPVDVREEGQIEDPFKLPTVRLVLGRNLEFEAFTVSVGGSAPVPLQFPLSLDVDLGYFDTDFNTSYLDGRAELSCGWLFEPFTVSAGLGIHTLLSAPEVGDSNLEVGVGGTVRATWADAGYPVEPTAEIRYSRLFEANIINVGIGVSRRF